MKRSREQFLTALNDLTGGNGELYEVADEGEKAVTIAVYPDVPDPGRTIAFSFGLSCASHEEWAHGKPELMISVKSRDVSWALCMGEIIRAERARCLFEHGSILHFKETIEDGSPLTSFFVFASNLLDQDQRTIVLEDRTINVAQIYPIYESEAALIRELGIQRFFWDLGIEFEDVHRAPAVLP